MKTKVKVKLLKAYNESKAGDVIEVGVYRANLLVRMKTAELVTESSDKSKDDSKPKAGRKPKKETTK